MASLEMVSTKMFECVSSDSSKKEKDLKVLVRDQSDNYRVFPVDDSGSKQDGKEVLECSSRTSVSETEESLQTLSSPETNSNPFYNLFETENPSRNEIIMGASSLVQIWEARSRPCSPTRNHFLIDSLFFESLSDEARNNGDEVDWCVQSNISDSCEKERESRCSAPLVRIRGRQAFEDFLMMILRERKKYLKWIAGLTLVSKFPPRGCERLQYMLRIRSFERCIAIRERHLFKSAKRSSRGSGVMNLRYKTNNASEATMIEATMSEDTSNKNGLQTHETESKATEEGEGSGETTEKGIVMGSVETNNTLGTAEKVNLWDSKERSNMRISVGKAARSGIDVEVTEVINIDTDGCRVNPQDVTSMISLEKRKEEENASSVSRESHTDEMFSKDDEETSKDKKTQEASETLFLTLESPRFLNGWVENDLVGEDEYGDYSGESVNYDWVSHISRPRSYWNDLRKERELEIIKKHSKKDDIFQKLIKERTVFSFLTSDFRKEIEKILISRPQKGLEVRGNNVDGEASEECSAEYQEKLKENETENVDLESVVVYDGFSQDSAKSTMKSWSFEDHEPYAKDHENTSSGIQMICDLREEIKKMQREMLELKGFVKSCVDFQKFKSASISDSLQGNCSVCFEKPIDSLLYRYVLCMLEEPDSGSV
ncbi:RING finger PFF0165c-like protein [Hirschfeldia incana]|nr:RING finger PFF0165c-like protein [Hirschfeldia incana]